MRIGILAIGKIDPTVPLIIQESVVNTFPDSTCSVIAEKHPLPEKAFDKKRKQYRSNLILGEVQGYAARQKELDRVLGIVDADIFVPKLNFVFGEACFPGRAALISLWRLKSELYGGASDKALFLGRSVKEAVHEIGHTLGLRHCSRGLCVMHFSNSIADTDSKQSLFCDQCYLQVAISIKSLG
jgi:archaemetzincin